MDLLKAIAVVAAFIVMALTVGSYFYRPLLLVAWPLLLVVWLPHLAEWYDAKSKGDLK